VSALTIRESVRHMTDETQEPARSMQLMARIANANAETMDALVEIEKIVSNVKSPRSPNGDGTAPKRHVAARLGENHEK